MCERVCTTCACFFFLFIFFSPYFKLFNYIDKIIFLLLLSTIRLHTKHFNLISILASKMWGRDTELSLSPLLTLRLRSVWHSIFQDVLFFEKKWIHNQSQRYKNPSSASFSLFNQGGWRMCVWVYLFHSFVSNCSIAINRFCVSIKIKILLDG